MSVDNAFVAPTAIKTSAYTAEDGDLVPVDTTGGGVTVTLPSPAPDRAVIAVKLVKGGGTVTVAAGGTDTFNDGGSGSFPISTLNQGVIFQYAEIPGVWYALSGDVAGGGGGGFSNPMTTAGDLIDGGTAGAAQRLAIGTSGQVLTVSGGAPAWQSPSPALPTTTLGDMVYENATPAPARLPGNTTSTKNFLTQTGTGSVSAAPAWGTIAAGDVPVLNQNTTGTASNITGTLDQVPAPAANVSLNSHKVTSLANGSAGTDAAAYGQTPAGGATVTIAQGGTGQTAQQAALDALAGAVTSGQVLRGNGTHVVLAAIQAGDLPAATTSTQGAVVLDGAAGDIQPLAAAAAAGAVGKAADAGHVHPNSKPWQFSVDDYGAKGDGKVTDDLATTSGSAVINSVGAPAPATPSVANSASGGTVAAGTYGTKVTYVNAHGETAASASSSTTTAGTTSKITVTAPAVVSGGVTGWNCYMTQAGGGTWTLQNATPVQIGTNFVLTAPPSSGGATPPGSNTTQSAPFTSGDVGKRVILNGANGATGAALLTTIASYTSATQVTLSANAGSTVASGVQMCWGTDDVSAINSALTAAKAYAQANDYYAQVMFGPKIYCLASGPTQSTFPYYNTQLLIPYPDSNTGRKLTIELNGVTPVEQCDYWESTVPSMTGTCLVSMITAPKPFDATYLQQSVIGGPSGRAGFIGGFANTMAVIRNLSVYLPVYTNAIGIDLRNVAACHADGWAVKAFCPANVGTGPLMTNLPANATFTGSIGVGFYAPLPGNNAIVNAGHGTVEGVATGLAVGDCFCAVRVMIAYINIGCLIDTANGLSSQVHTVNLGHFGASAVNGIIKPSGTGTSPFITLYGILDAENTSVVYDVSDAGNEIHGLIHWNDLLRSTGVPTITGGVYLKVINDNLGPGVWGAAGPPANGTAPSVPASGTAQQNTSYRDATVLVAGGAVTQVTVDGIATGLTSGMFRVPGGKNITLTYTAAPVWTWWLD